MEKDPKDQASRRVELKLCAKAIYALIRCPSNAEGSATRLVFCRDVCARGSNHCRAGERNSLAKCPKVDSSLDNRIFWGCTRTGEL